MDIILFSNFLLKLNEDISNLFNREEDYAFPYIDVINSPVNNSVPIDKLIDNYTSDLSIDFFQKFRRFYLNEDSYEEMPLLNRYLEDYNGIKISEGYYIDFKDECFENKRSRDSLYFKRICQELLKLNLPQIEKIFNDRKSCKGEFREVNGIFLAHYIYNIKYISNLVSFNCWINFLNDGMCYNARDIDEIEKCNIKLPFRGTEEDLNSIPRNTELIFFKYPKPYECFDPIEIKKKMQVIIQDDEITITYNKNKLAEDYFNEIVNSIQRIRLDIDNYRMIDEELLPKAKYLMENKIKCQNIWFQGYQITEILDDYETIKNMAIEKDNETWDGTFGHVVMMNVSDNTLNRYYRAVRDTGVVLIKLAM